MYAMGSLPSRVRLLEYTDLRPHLERDHSSNLQKPFLAQPNRMALLVSLAQVEDQNPAHRGVQAHHENALQNFLRNNVCSQGLFLHNRAGGSTSRLSIRS